jgi:N-dimethylarginine dimethylaminohydrolase
VFNEYSRLKAVAVRHPRDAFAPYTSSCDIWEKLDWLDRPDVEAARTEFDIFTGIIHESGADIIMQPAGQGLSPDALYVRDATLITPVGIIECNMGKPARRTEPAIASDIYRQLGFKIAGTIEAPGTIEGGDIIWIDDKTLVVGVGYRTNLSGVAQMEKILGPEIEVVTVNLPHWNGPRDVFHLMSMISPLDQDLALVYPRPVPVTFIHWLQDRGISLINVPDEEYDTMGCNVLALSPRKILALDTNPKTRQALERAGCEVITYSGREISAKGCGGPTCLTRPLERG